MLRVKLGGPDRPNFVSDEQERNDLENVRPWRRVGGLNIPEFIARQRTAGRTASKGTEGKRTPGSRIPDSNSGCAAVHSKRQVQRIRAAWSQERQHYTSQFPAVEILAVGRLDPKRETLAIILITEPIFFQ